MGLGQWWRQVWSWLPGMQKPVSQRELLEGRSAVRHLITSDRLMASLRGNSAVVRVRNLSATGISLVLPHAVEAETVLPLELLNLGRMFICKVDMRVVYTLEHPSGDWILGCAFLRKLTDEELQALLV